MQQKMCCSFTSPITKQWVVFNKENMTTRSEEMQGYGFKIDCTASENSDTKAPTDRKLFCLPLSVPPTRSGASVYAFISIN